MEQRFKREFFTNLPERSTEEIYRNPNMQLPFDPEDVIMFLDRSAAGTASELSRRLRVLPYHHRSADLGVTTEIHEQGTTPYGRVNNVFCQIDIKGGGFVYPEEYEEKKEGISRGELAESGEVMVVNHDKENVWGYEVYGLVDRRHAGTALRVAQFLSSIGMRTEGVAGVYALKIIRWQGKETPVDSFKEEICADQLRKLEDASVSDEYRQRMLLKVDDFRKNFEPVEIIRLMRSVIRWRDLKDEKDRGVRQEMVAEACRCLNIEAEALGKADRFGSETVEERKRWLQFVVHEVGRNGGLIHRSQAKHGFLHMGNLTMAGEIVDLDSVVNVVVQGKGKGARYKDANFFKQTAEGYACINPEVRGGGEPHEQYGLPKCLVKDMRDICFSVRQMFNASNKDFFGGQTVDRAALAKQVVDGYAQSLQGAEPFGVIDISTQRLVEVMAELANEIIYLDKTVKPIL